MFLVVVDACSKWLEVHLMNSTTSTATIEKLRETFANHGLPKTIVSDNGSNFTSAEFEQFTVKNGIKHIKVAPYTQPPTDKLNEQYESSKKDLRKWKVAVYEQNCQDSS
ncbi:hypothetical protein QZH41_006930 [Actinostola sp. cb2023]|nr:hypothetical protein QZH41_006930 [Actinostola sp. cb2023]